MGRRNVRRASGEGWSDRCQHVDACAAELAARLHVRLIDVRLVTESFCVVGAGYLEMDERASRRRQGPDTRLVRWFGAPYAPCPRGRIHESVQRDGIFLVWMQRGRSLPERIAHQRKCILIETAGGYAPVSFCAASVRGGACMGHHGGEPGIRSPQCHVCDVASRSIAVLTVELPSRTSHTFCAAAAVHYICKQ